jgi:hypothetical protein
MNKLQKLVAQSVIVVLYGNQLQDEKFDQRQLLLAKAMYEKEVDRQLRKGLDLRNM